MKKGFKASVLILIIVGACIAQTNDLYKDSKPASTNSL